MKPPQFRLRTLVITVVAVGTVIGLVANVLNPRAPVVDYLLSWGLLVVLVLVAAPTLWAVRLTLRDQRRGETGPSRPHGRQGWARSWHWPRSRGQRPPSSAKSSG